MLILGINGGFRQGYQDVSACLIENGKLIAAVEEERLSRVKFSAGRLPFLSVLEVLKISGKRIEDIDLVTCHGSTWEDEITGKITSYFQYHFGFAPPVKRFHHHDCHAVSSFFASGFDKALIFTLDNSGDGVSLQVAIGEKEKIEVIKRFYRPDSLGIFYSLITQYCGFTRDSDEYKLMGLSSYGNRKEFDFSWLINFSEGELKINQDFLIPVLPQIPSPHRDEMLFSYAFTSKMGKGRRIPGTAITDFYKDVAASAQEHFERMVLEMVSYYSTQTAIDTICLAGGAALNCVLNQKLMNAPFVRSLFVQPASGDDGISLGAAWLGSIEHGVKPIVPENYYTGTSFSNDDIKHLLQVCGVKHQFVMDPHRIAAELIADNKVIAWFRGGAEFGPRALGNRSILANAANPDMQKIVNEKIKFRESFRPFCPAVLEEDATAYFTGKQFPAPYMIITYDVKEDKKNVIPAVTHIDGTSRIQTVNRSQNPHFYDLLSELKKITGHGVVLNTSFNLSHEPMVYSPKDALATFFSSGIEILFLENYMVTK